MKPPIQFSVCLCAALWTVNAGAQPAADPRAPAEGPSVTESARELLLRGVDALSRDDFELAYPPLAQAWQLRHSYDVAAALGQSELGLKRYRDACEHLAFARREFPPSERLRILQRIEAGLASAREHVAKLTLTFDQPGQLLIDGTAVGRGPLKLELFMDPGEHQIEIRPTTGEPATQRLITGAGASYQLDLHSDPRPSEANAIPADPVPVPSAETQLKPSPSSRHVVLIGGSAITLALIGVGIAERVRSANAADDARTLQSQLPQNCALSQASATCRRLQSKLDERNDANRVAAYTFAGAGVTGLATFALFALWPSQRTTGRNQNPPLIVHLSDRSALLSFTSSF